MPRFLRAFALLSVLLSLTGNIPCQAASVEVSAASCVLMDAGSGRVLYAKDELTERPIASTTKLMTALVALEHCRLPDLKTVKREQLREGSSMYLREGERVSMEALLYGLLLPSGNDAAECVAASCGVPRETFVRWMNDKAAALGMTHTHFMNPSGLDEKGHYSCALDMARLMACAMENPTFVRIASTRTAAAGERQMTNHNKLLGSVEGCIGGKTGYTGDAGRTLVTCAERDGLRLVAVTLRDGQDWKDHAALYDWGFATYHVETFLRKDEPRSVCAVRGGEMSAVSLLAGKSLSCPLKDGETATLRVVTEPEVRAPVRAGQVLGEAQLILDGSVIARVPLRAAADVKKVEQR